jgi:hypothetical protein
MRAAGLFDTACTRDRIENPVRVDLSDELGLERLTRGLGVRFALRVLRVRRRAGAQYPFGWREI